VIPEVGHGAIPEGENEVGAIPDGEDGEVICAVFGGSGGDLGRVLAASISDDATSISDVGNAPAAPIVGSVLHAQAACGRPAEPISGGTAPISGDALSIPGPDMHAEAGAILAPALVALAAEEGMADKTLLPYQLLERFDDALIAGRARRLWEQTEFIIGFHPDEVSLNALSCHPARVVPSRPWSYAPLSPRSCRLSPRLSPLNLVLSLPLPIRRRRRSP
jgi:hypothetical protein